MALTPTAKKNAITGKNTLVAYRLADQTPEASFVTIPGVQIFTGLGGSVEDIDQNNMTLRQRARMLYMSSPMATSMALLLVSFIWR